VNDTAFPPPETILGKTIDCQCGRSHTIPVKSIVYSEDALSQLTGIVGEAVAGKTVTVVSDKRTHEIAGRDVESVLQPEGWSVSSHIVPDDGDHSPTCDDVTLNALRAETGEPDVFIAVGGGVINDLVKWLSHEKEIPYAVVATAATMNGYTAANVAPTVDGVKMLVRAHAPFAVLAVPSIIESAPFNLTASGLADAVAKSVSVADWQMNHILYDEHYCEYCAEIISSIEPWYFDNPENVAKRTSEGIKAVLTALLYSGLAMTMIGSSSPASGGEHLFSHTLDMMSSVDGVPHDLHGRQVGLGTIFSAVLYERIQNIESPRISNLPDSIDHRFWGKLAESVSTQYQAKQNKLQHMRDVLGNETEWRHLRDTVCTKAVAADRVAKCLKTAGAARYVEDIGCTAERVKMSLLHMHEIRTRPTVVDLAWMLGILPGAVDEIVDEWLIKR